MSQTEFRMPPPRRVTPWPGILLLASIVVGVLGATGAHAQKRRAPVPSTDRDLRAETAIQQVFRAWDVDGDGVVGAGEGPGPSFLRQLDTDDDGSLNLDEARAIVRLWRGGQAHRRDRYDPARERGPMAWALDVPYVEHVDDPLRTLDIYRPAGDASERRDPVVVMVHGGGWVLGDKTNLAVAQRKAPFFTRSGVVYVTVNYRLSPEVRHPTHVQDVAGAVAWVHENIADHGGDPDRIFVMGHSAGAHLAALVAVDDLYLDWYGKSRSIVAGVILVDGGAYDMPAQVSSSPAGSGTRELFQIAFGPDEDEWARASPARRISRDGDYPPFLLFHVARSEVPATQASLLSRRLRKAGTKARVIAVRDRDHHSINAGIGRTDDPVTTRILNFVRTPRGRVRNPR